RGGAFHHLPGGNEVGHMGGEDLNITLYFWLHGASPPFKRVWGPPAERRGPGGRAQLRRAGRVCRRQVVPFGPSQVRTCGVVPRPGPGGGSRLSLEKARTQRVAGGCPPPPLVYSPLVGTRSFWRG